jgi:hypothetical protein
VQPIQQLDPANAAAATASGEPTLAEFLRKLNITHWLILLYPLVLLAVHRRRDEADLAVVDGSATAQIAYMGVCGVWMVWRLFQSMRQVEPILITDAAEVAPHSTASPRWRARRGQACPRSRRSVRRSGSCSCC